MKRVVIAICLIFLFVIIYLLQSNFFSWFNLAGVTPNLFVIFVLIIGLFSGRGMGSAFGIFFGIFIDFLIGKNIGISGIMLGIIGFLGGHLDKSFSKDSRITLITMVVLATFTYEMGIVVLNLFINEAQINMWYVIKTLIIELIFNSIITIIIYPIIIRFGYRIEENFKENKILTRYF